SAGDRVLVSGKPAEPAAAITEAARVLAGARGRVLVGIGPDLSSQAQREAVAIADLLGATVDTATSPAAAAGLLAAQRRGRATATLGEIRNRADVVLFWAVDPGSRYPRYLSRYALDPAGTHVPEGRRGRTVISANVGGARGPTGADLSLDLSADEEIPALSVMRGTVAGNPLGDLPAALQAAAEVARRLMQAGYAVIVHDGESAEESGPAQRAEGLVALAQALNGPTRAALSTLRAGGNRSGAEAVLTSQTGYPMAVDYSSGVPRYAPALRGLDRLGRGGFQAALLVGRTDHLSAQSRSALGGVATVVIGPRATETAGPRVAIDTGVAGIHEAGTAYRMDEVPVPLRAPLRGARSAAGTLRELLTALRSEAGPVSA
ncbi:MAG: hypothetical protein ACREMG_09830, partial [Gemmatimonadales bacterium]